MLLCAVPGRHGALTDRADRLPAGCRALAALAGEVLGTPVREVPVVEAGSPTERGVANRHALVASRTAHLAVLEAPEGPVLTIGGDCGVDLVPLGVARYRYGERLGVAWFDAHADLNTADSSPSGAFHGMVLRSLLGEGDPEFAASPALSPGRAALLGTRTFDPAERSAVDAGLVRHLADAGDPTRVAETMRATGAERVYVHIDLDVLDPDAFAGMDYPEPDGLTVDELAAGVAALAEFEVIGAAVTECVTTDPAELARLVPILEALATLLESRE